MHGIDASSLGLLAVLLGVACSSATSTSFPDGGHDDAPETSEPSSDGNAATNDVANTDGGGNSDPAPTSAPGDTAPPGNTALPDDATLPGDDTSPPNPAVEHWALVRVEDSERAFAEEWEYDAASRLVKARVARFRRDQEPVYAVDVTITYDGNQVTSVHDAAPAELVDVKYQWELEAGRVVSYVESTADETHDSRVFTYDGEGRLVGSYENYYGDESVWTLERREGGEPSQLLQDGEVVCSYSWRHVWLGTTCYLDGAVSQTYEPDTSGRLGGLTIDGSQTVRYTYDDAGHLTSQTSGETVYEYRYSAEARLLEARGPGYEELRSYDDSGLLEQIRWTDESATLTTTFTYARVAADEVLETETSPAGTVVRTYRRLAHPPQGEPQLPSYWTVLRMDQPSVYMAPVDYSKVP